MTSIDVNIPEIHQNSFKERFEGTTEEGRIRGLDSEMAGELSGAIEEGEEEVKRTYGDRFLGKSPPSSRKSCY